MTGRLPRCEEMSVIDSRRINVNLARALCNQLLRDVIRQSGNYIEVSDNKSGTERTLPHPLAQ